jgi:hypothetical protein
LDKKPVSLKQVVLINLLSMVILLSAFLTYRALAAPEGAPDAQVSGMDVLAYQGTLVDAGGDPVDGAREMTFRIYNHPTETGALWAEAHTGPNAVPVQNGLFNVTLGSLNPIPDSIWNEADLYLGVQVDGDPEMTPREAIHLLPPRIEAGSLDAAVLKSGTMSGDPFHVYGFNFVDEIAFSNRGTGEQTTLDPDQCAVDNAWCCNDADTICLKRNPSGEDILALRLNDDHSIGCWLVHQDDDLPISSDELTYSTDRDGAAAPFPEIGNVFYFMRPGAADIPIAVWAEYLVLCLD